MYKSIFIRLTHFGCTRAKAFQFQLKHGDAAEYKQSCLKTVFVMHVSLAMFQTEGAVNALKTVENRVTNPTSAMS